MVASAAFERWWRGLMIGCTLATGAAAALLAFGPVGHPRRRAGVAAPPSSARLVDRRVASSGCGSRPPVRPGTTVQMIVGIPRGSAAGARTRSYWLHVPVGYVRDRPTPLVLAFHGAGGSALGMQRLTQLSGLADRRGLLVAYPQGLVQPGAGNRVGWDSSGPRDPEAHGIDDGLFVSEVLNQLQARYCVDPDRIGATGFSNGAGLVGYLACVLAGRIAAFAPVEGEFFIVPGGCHPSRPVSILDVHVFTDPVAPYAGVPARGSPDYYAPSIPTWLASWALRDGCRRQPRVLLHSTAQTAEQWVACDLRTAVLGYRVAAGGHSWPGKLGAAGGGDAIIAFLGSHPLAAPIGSWSPHPGYSVPRVDARALAVRSVRQFRVPTLSAEPLDIARGADGNMWFSEFDGDKIGRISPDGTVREFRVPTAGAEPYEITAGPDGSMWFTEYNTVKLGRITARGVVTELTLARWSAGGFGLTKGRAGALWVADPAGDVDRISRGGQISRIKVSPASGTPFAIASIGAGGVWFSAFTGYFEHARRLERIGAPGPRHSLTLPDRASDIDALAADASGGVWFTDYGTGHIGEVAPSGRRRVFADPSPDGGLNDIAMGPDGAMWFTDQAGLIGRVTPAGNFSQLALPTAGCAPDGISAGPGRTVWAAEPGADAIARITLK